MEIETIFPDLAQNIPLFGNIGSQKRDPPDTHVGQSRQETKGVLHRLFSQAKDSDGNRTLSDRSTNFLRRAYRQEGPIVFQGRKTLAKESLTLSAEEIDPPGERW